MNEQGKKRYKYYQREIGKERAMTEFVKVMKNSQEHNITNTEIIRADCLVKVYKHNGNIGTGICFEWFCESRNEYLTWEYDCGYKIERDRMFSQYEKLLTGTEIEERASEYKGCED